MSKEGDQFISAGRIVCEYVTYHHGQNYKLKEGTHI